MTYAFATINQADTGVQTVRGPRVTDVIGNALRNAFNEPRGLPDDMMRILRQIDGGRC